MKKIMTKISLALTAATVLASVNSIAGTSTDLSEQNFQRIIEILSTQKLDCSGGDGSGIIINDYEAHLKEIQDCTAAMKSKAIARIQAACKAGDENVYEFEIKEMLNQPGILQETIANQKKEIRNIQAGRNQLKAHEKLAIIGLSCVDKDGEPAYRTAYSAVTNETSELRVLFVK